ncbi:hypothetical protein JTE90_001403 [Oedothorax gibbosus]|uniref:Uncharacterized protein n=1 Tax=Oedothorax gibbosus TaxID=931172 RepID=A0AAV6VFJ6_9ARAC|nr:hypothetical protein JTE90_001403 [Oedothorax gibbosus]
MRYFRSIASTSGTDSNLLFLSTNIVLERVVPEYSTSFIVLRNKTRVTDSELATGFWIFGPHQISDVG